MHASVRALCMIETEFFSSPGTAAVVVAGLPIPAIIIISACEHVCVHVCKHVCTCMIETEFFSSPGTAAVVVAGLMRACL